MRPFALREDDTSDDAKRRQRGCKWSIVLEPDRDVEPDPYASLKRTLDEAHVWPGLYTFKFIIDGIIYGCLTGGTFGWLWPKAM